MSVEKLTDASKTTLEKNPFAQISNKVIIHIKDNDAFRLYSYLASKTREWKVIKEWTAEECGIGKRKAKQCWAYLERCGLIEYLTLRNAKGKFINHDIKVLNGAKFKKNEPFLHEPTGAVSAPLDIHRCNYPPGGESTRVDIAPLLKKDIKQNNDNNKKQRERLKAFTLPHDFIPTKQTQEKILKLDLSQEILNAEHRKFYLHYEDSGIKKTNWEAEYCKWMLNAEIHINSKKRK